MAENLQNEKRTNLSLEVKAVQIEETIDVWKKQEREKEKERNVNNKSTKYHTKACSKPAQVLTLESIYETYIPAILRKLALYIIYVHH